MIDDGRLYSLLGERLRKLREGFDGPAGRLTQAALASRVGLERTSITNIEKGAQRVGLHVLYAICEELEVSVVDVLPTLAEVMLRTEAALPAPKMSVEFGGKSFDAPPKALLKISEILNQVERDERS